MTEYNVNVPAAAPRTLVRTPQLNPILAAMRAAQDGLYLKGTATGTVEWAAAEMTQGGSIGGSTSVNVTTPVPPPPPSTSPGGWTIASAGSDASKTATWEGARPCVVWLVDTRETTPSSAALVIDAIEDMDGAVGQIARTGIHAKMFTRPDRGESSAGLFVQTGGGGTLTAYKAHRLRPANKPNLSYSFQGVIEAASEDMGQAALFQAGAYFPTSAGHPDPTLTSAINATQQSIPLTATTYLPRPGSPTPYTENAPALWPTPLYAQFWADPTGNPATEPQNAFGGEVISYTGGGWASSDGAQPLTGVVRGVGTATPGTGLPHALGTKLSPICASSAIMVRMASPLSKGMTFVPVGGAPFDARPAITIGINNHGQPQELSPRLNIRMNGDIETAGNVSLTLGSLSVAGNLNVAGQTGSLTTTTGTYTALNLASSGNLTVGGQAAFAGGQSTLRLVNVITPTTLSAQANDYNPTGLATAAVMRMSTASPGQTLTGITAQPAGTVLSVVNAGTFNLVLAYEGGLSLPAHRFLLPGGVNMTLTPQSAVQLWYDAASSRWRPLGGGPG